MARPPAAVQAWPERIRLAIAATERKMERGPKLHAIASTVAARIR